MYVVIGEKLCPSCGIKGKRWKRKPEVLICPKCNTFYNEFGIIIESQSDEEVRFT